MINIFFRESFTKSRIKQHSVKIGRKNMWHYVMTDEWLIIPVWTITCQMFMVSIFTFYCYNLSCRFLNPKYLFPFLNSDCSIVLDLTNPQEQVKEAVCFNFQALNWPFIVKINCCCYLKTFANSWPSASN